jgi:hypothetical protein
MTTPLSRWLVFTRPVVAGFHLAGDNSDGLAPAMPDKDAGFIIRPSQAATSYAL